MAAHMGDWSARPQRRQFRKIMRNHARPMGFFNSASVASLYPAGMAELENMGQIVRQQGQ